MENMTVARGLKHKYVGIEIEFMGDGKVTMFQKVHLFECIETFGKDVTASVASLDRKGLFDVNADDELLDKNRSAIFHSMVQ